MVALHACRTCDLGSLRVFSTTVHESPTVLQVPLCSVQQSLDCSSFAENLTKYSTPPMQMQFSRNVAFFLAKNMESISTEKPIVEEALW